MSGKICTRCQTNKDYSGFYRSKQAKDGYESWCKDCRIELSRKRYAPKKEKIKDERQEYYRDGLKRCKECEQYKPTGSYGHHSTHWDRLNHICSQCIKNRKYQKNPETSKKWYQNNRIHTLQRGKEWAKNNRDKTRAIWHRYKTRKINAIGKFTASQIEKLKQYYCPDGKCLKCYEVRKLTIDHVVPLSKGGSNCIENIQLLCGNCNSGKCNYHSMDFRPDKGEFARSLMDD